MKNKSNYVFSSELPKDDKNRNEYKKENKNEYEKNYWESTTKSIKISLISHIILLIYSMYIS